MEHIVKLTTGGIVEFPYFANVELLTRYRLNLIAHFLFI